MRKSFRTDFDFGDEVCLKTDRDVKRIVSGFLVRPKGITIGLVKGEEETWHQPIEIITIKRPIVIKGFKKI